MTGEVQSFQALEAQAQVMMSLLTAANYEVVAPAVIQPADVFLDVVGETLRARTYVFSDPDGTELCLRPDITVPVARLHLARLGQLPPTAGSQPAPARYCYNGPAFRYQPSGANEAHPREFRQAGLELLGAAEREAADAEVVTLTLRALEAAGLTGYSLRMGDIAIVASLLTALPIPERWRRRLMDRFWRPDAFRAELKRLSTDPGEACRRLDADLRAAIRPDDRAGTERAIAAHAGVRGLELSGARTFRDIADRLIEVVEDASLPKLPKLVTRTIGDLLAIEVPASEATARIDTLVRAAGLDLSGVLRSAELRLQLIAKAGLDTAAMTFEADFGRTIEYYSGFVFEVHGPALSLTSPVAGGGRYDRLMRVIGAGRDVPAVGSAIHTERVLRSVQAMAKSAIIPPARKGRAR